MVADGFGEVGGVGLVCLGLGDVLPGVLVGRRAVGWGRVSVAGLGCYAGPFLFSSGTSCWFVLLPENKKVSEIVRK